MNIDDAIKAARELVALEQTGLTDDQLNRIYDALDWRDQYAAASEDKHNFAQDAIQTFIANFRPHLATILADHERLSRELAESQAREASMQAALEAVRDWKRPMDADIESALTKVMDEIKTCPECARMKDHPVSRGICSGGKFRHYEKLHGLLERRSAILDDTTPWPIVGMCREALTPDPAPLLDLVAKARELIAVMWAPFNADDGGPVYPAASIELRTRFAKASDAYNAALAKLPAHLRDWGKG